VANPVVAYTVQSLQRPQRLEKFPHNYFSTIIIDEAHHAVTDGYRRILDWFPAAKVLGVTATPDRGDLRNLGEVFDSLAYEYKLTDAIRDGFLCRIMAQTIPLRLDISTVGMSGGDYAVGELGSALDPYLDQIVDFCSLSAACSSSSPRWARISTRSPARTWSSATAANTMVLPVPVGSTSSVRSRPCSHSVWICSFARC